MNSHNTYQGINELAHAPPVSRRASWEAGGAVAAIDGDHASALSTTNKTVLRATVALTVGMVAWAGANLANGWVGFAAILPVGFRGGGEAAISLARLFAALVLFLIAADRIGGRLRWVASGFVVLGLGQLLFGYVEPIVDSTTDVNDALYQMILVRTLAAALFVVGLWPTAVPRLSWRIAAAISAFACASVAAYWVSRALSLAPPLVRVESLEEAARLRIAPMSWLTPWHWALAIPPLGFAVAATIGAVERYQRGEIGGWLPISIVLLAGSELHDSLWPSAYGNSMLMNTADVLRLAMAAAVVAGGTLELRRIAGERAALLAAEQARARHLEELTRLKADFSAMVAHELGHPLSAIRRQAEMLSRDGVGSGLRDRALAAILRETDSLDTLVADMQTTATVERDDFAVELRPVPIADLVRSAEAAAQAHSGARPLDIALGGVDVSERVLADPERIGQVLRNLLCNAAKYSQGEARITLRLERGGGSRIRFAVADRGPGIHPDDLPHIFEKFGRGQATARAQVTGNGLGLYLSRRIVRAHGSDLTVRSRLGAGSVFSFELSSIRGEPGGERQ